MVVSFIMLFYDFELYKYVRYSLNIMIGLGLVHIPCFFPMSLLGLRPLIMSSEYEEGRYCSRLIWVSNENELENDFRAP